MPCVSERSWACPLPRVWGYKRGSDITKVDIMRSRVYLLYISSLANKDQIGCLDIMLKGVMSATFILCTGMWKYVRACAPHNWCIVLIYMPYWLLISNASRDFIAHNNNPDNIGCKVCWLLAFSHMCPMVFGIHDYYEIFLHFYLKLWPFPLWFLNRLWLLTLLKLFVK